MNIFKEEFGYEESFRAAFHKEEYKIKMHLHQFSEMICVTQGKLRLTVDGKKYELTDGKAAIITPFQLHDVYSEADCEFFMCVFSNNCVPNYHTDKKIFYNRNNAVFTPSPALTISVEQLKSLAVTNRIRINESTVPRSIKAMLYLAFTEYIEAAPELSELKKHDALSSALLYVNEHYLEDISIRSVGRSLGYNPKYLSQCLSTLPNMSFPSLLNSLRIDHAKNLLLSTDFKVIDIALECGYKNEQSFHRAFLAITGMTPKEYKKSRN